MQLPSSVTPRVRPMPESDDDCDDFDDNVFDERFVQMVRARSKTSFLETSQTRRGREPPERGAHASNAVFYGNQSSHNSVNRFIRVYYSTLF